MSAASRAAIAPVEREHADKHFVGLSHTEALEREVSPTSQLVETLVEAGTLGTIAALPESHKSFLAVELAHKVVAGGLLLDRFEILRTGPVGYWWQDDSEANELRRLQDYARRHGHTGELPIRWHLNEGLRLPDDLDALRAEVERESQVLVVLDSLYNFLPGLNLKDEDVALVLAAVKAEVSDPTGCAVCFIDHAPWPTENTRGQRRGYGSVFKAAVIRWGIYLDREGEKLWVEARGNNVAGLKRSLAVWNEEELELRLVDVDQADEEERQQRVLDYLSEHPAASTTVVEKGAKGRAETVRKTLKTLEEAGRVTSRSSRDLGRGGTGTYWFLIVDAPLQSVPLPGTGSDAQPSQSESSSGRPTPVGGTGSGRTDSDGHK